MAPQIVDVLWDPQHNTERMGDLIDFMMQFHPLYSFVLSVRYAGYFIKQKQNKPSTKYQWNI